MEKTSVKAFSLVADATHVARVPSVPAPLKSCAVKINRARIDAALSSEQFVIPSGLDREEIRKFIMSHA